MDIIERLKYSLLPAPSHEIARLQRLYPPLYDRKTTALSDALLRLPEEDARLFHSGNLAYGEVGLLDAQVVTRPLRWDRYVIVLHSGFRRLIYSVSRALGAATNIFGPSGAPEAKAHLDIDQFAELVSKAFEPLRHGDAPGHPDHPADYAQLELAVAWTNEVAAFYLLHELAHIVIAIRARRGTHTRLGHGVQTHEEELASDQIALRWSLDYALGRTGQKPVSHPRMIYSGIELALRIWALLENISFQFANTHPAAVTRLEALQTAAQAQCEKAGVPFDALRRVAIVNDEYLDAVEKVLTGQAPRTKQTQDRIRAKLLAVSEEYAKGTMERDRVVDVIGHVIRYSETDTFAHAYDEAYQALLQRNPAAATALATAVGMAAREPMSAPVQQDARS